MRKNKTPVLKRLHLILGIFLVISILVFVGIGISIYYQDLAETYTLAEETTSFLKMECQKYDNYTRGISASSLQNLLDTADGLNQFISSESLSDSDFLQTFIRTEHIGGVLVLDSNLSLIAQADMDHQDSYDLWQTTVCKSKIKDILKHPQKTYVGHISAKHKFYDVAVVASADQKKMILCYSSTEKPASDPYELTLKSVLTNNNFYKNPTLVITDGTQVLSTNSTIVDELGASQYSLLSKTIKWKKDHFTRFKYQNTVYYGLHKVYGNYQLYAVYDSKDMFAHRTAYISFALMLYLGVGIIILAVQRHSDKVSINKMEKQLRIINAISSSYNSTFLLHTDSMEMEVIHVSDRLSALVKKHPQPCELLFAVCRTEIEPDFYPTVMHFLNLDTIAERLKGKASLGCEIKDCNGAWFSVMLIPQKCDAEGNILALLITTRDITAVKQTEELTFKDQLTGMHNRNYMESRSKNFVRSGDLPVSLIMADCNYLKRTNDTLGHEYGDLLLQRVANIIMECISDECVAMRIGGDEFLILCTHCSNEKAYQMIADMKKKMIERSDDKLVLSVAFGVSTTVDGEFSFEEAYEEADQAMYQDKKASRIKR